MSDRLKNVIQALFGKTMAGAISWTFSNGSGKKMAYKEHLSKAENLHVAIYVESEPQWSYLIMKEMFTGRIIFDKSYSIESEEGRNLAAIVDKSEKDFIEMPFKIFEELSGSSKK